MRVPGDAGDATIHGCGQEDSRPVLAFRLLACSGEIWERAAALAQMTGREIIAPDLPAGEGTELADLVAANLAASAASVIGQLGCRLPT